MQRPIRLKPVPHIIITSFDLHASQTLALCVELFAPLTMLPKPLVQIFGACYGGHLVHNVHSLAWEFSGFFSLFSYRVRTSSCEEY